MNQIKIGRFIANCRKEQGLTQMQLAERLSITDKAISKWERGVAMPDSSIMLELCGILKISVNELLSGERSKMEKSDEKNEQLLLEMAKELGCNKMNIGIVEENQVLRKWYETFGFLHIKTQKFDFFPFTCGYMEKYL